MAYVAQVKDGKIQTTETQKYKSVEEKSNSSLDKDAFLKLLTAEMQYQDPLEPTSNTDYIAQFATFSQVESLTNMEDTMKSQNAYNLVGKDVVIRTTSNSDGESLYVDGRVEYVKLVNNEAYVCVGGELYPAANVDTVVDEKYLNAYDTVEAWEKELKKLPKADLITMSDEARIVTLQKVYESMTDYEKSFIDDDSLKYYRDALESYTTLKNAIENTAKENGNA